MCGDLAEAFISFLKEMWTGNDESYYPIEIKVCIKIWILLKNNTNIPTIARRSWDAMCQDSVATLKKMHKSF